MLLKFGIFGALALSIFWGVIDTFTDPTPEKAALILQPTPERIETSKSLVDPFLAWVSALTPEAFVQLVKDADADVRDKLANNPLPITTVVTEPVAAPAGATATSPGTASGTTATAADSSTGQPGLDWYTSGAK